MNRRYSWMGIVSINSVRGMLLKIVPFSEHIQHITVEPAIDSRHSAH